MVSEQKKTNNTVFQLDTTIGRYCYPRDTHLQCGEGRLHVIPSFIFLYFIRFSLSPALTQSLKINQVSFDIKTPNLRSYFG